MKTLSMLVLSCLAPFALADNHASESAPAVATEEAAKPAPAPEPEPANPDADADAAATPDAEEVDPALAEAALLAELEEAAAASAKMEEERLAKIAAERAKAKGEKHESLTTTKNKTYNKVTITGIDDLGIKIMHEAGTARIKFPELPEELRERFGYDPAKASAQLGREKSIEAARIRRVVDELKFEAGAKSPSGTARSAPKRAYSRSSAKTNSDNPEIKELQTKIDKMEAGIASVEKVAAGYDDQAQKIYDRATGDASVTNGGGGGKRGGYGRVDESKLKMAERWRDKAKKEYEKVEAARDLIDKYRDQIRDIERGVKR